MSLSSKQIYQLFLLLNNIRKIFFFDLIYRDILLVLCTRKKKPFRINYGQ
jgi:hypothetical protein